MQNGSLTVHTPKEATNIDGIYTDNGSVNINGGIKLCVKSMVIVV